jgi:xanthine dehydrogenase molybdenum-binding subunit
MRHVGKDVKRLIADQIVTGSAIFTADIKKPHMAYGRVLRSPHAYAEILKIDAGKALAMEGVYAVVTYEDVGDDQYITNGFTPPKHARLLNKIVKFAGEAVALVVADTEDLADEAIDLIHVEYRVMKPVLNIDAALAPDAPELYSECPGNIAPAKTNLHFEIGDIEAGFAQADEIFEDDFFFETGQNPLAAEPPTVLTWWDGERLYVTGSIAAIAYCQQNVQASLNIPYENITTEAPCVGGSFGSKLFSGNVQPVVYSALMSKKARRPVMYIYSKEEHFATHQIRMATKAHFKLGLKKDGTVTAVQCRQYAEAGYCATTQEFMMGVGALALNFLCKTPNQKFDGDIVITNRMPSGSFRGYGYLEIVAMMSRILSNACKKFGIDPVDYYCKNCVDHGDTFFTAKDRGQEWQISIGPSWPKVFRIVADEFGWKDRFKGWGAPTWISPDGKKARGVGMAIGGQNDVGHKQSNTTVEINGMGSVLLSTAMGEFGAGTRDLMRKIVAEELNCPLEFIRMSIMNTDANPPDFGSTGSRSTYCGGVTALWAAQDLKKKLFEYAGKKLDIPSEDLGLKDGNLFRLSNPSDIISLAPRVLGKVDGLTGYGHFEGAFNVTMYNIQFVEVEVDMETGAFDVIELVMGCDPGRVLNPAGMRNQLDGFLAGIGLAAFEETVFDPRNNRVLNPNMIEYKTGTFNNVPKRRMVIHESFKDDTKSPLPFGAFGAGEPTISPSGPAIRMALYNACGVNLDDYPFLPAKIIEALKTKEV